MAKGHYTRGGRLRAGPKPSEWVPADAPSGHASRSRMSRARVSSKVDATRQLAPQLEAEDIPLVERDRERERVKDVARADVPK